MVPWRFWITYIVIIFTTLLWFFLDPRSLPKLPNFGTPSFCNPWSTVFTGHILLDVCPSTRTRSMYRGLRDGRSSTLPLPAAINWLCHGWDFAPPPSTSHVCLAECCTGLGHSVKASRVPICPAVSGKRQSLVVIPHLGGSANHSAHSPAGNLGPWWGRGVVWLSHLPLGILQFYNLHLDHAWISVNFHLLQKEASPMRMGECAKSTGMMIPGQFNIIYT